MFPSLVTSLIIGLIYICLLCVKSTSSTPNIVSLTSYDEDFDLQQITANYANNPLTHNLPQAELDALYSFYISLEGVNWNWYWAIAYPEYYGIPWDFSTTSPSNPCADNWHGVTCSCIIANVKEYHPYAYNVYYDDDSSLIYYPGVGDTVECHVQKIHPYNMNLGGSLPSSIELFPYLTHLHLGYNLIRGSIPFQLFQLSGLIVLELYDNFFQGTLPISLGESLPSLQHLNLAFNHLTGRLPSGGLSAMTSLKTLILSINRFSGSIPEEIGSLSLLTGLYLNNNRLIGSLPQSIGSLSHLARLSLYSNQLNGTLPVSLTDLTSLSELNLRNNSFSGRLPSVGLEQLVSLRILNAYNNSFSGPLPENLGDLVSLEELYLGMNFLTGSFPESFGDLQALRILELQHNDINSTLTQARICQLTRLTVLNFNSLNLNGTIPSCIGDLTDLTRLQLHENRLTGSLPRSLFDLSSLVVLDLYKNRLKSTIPSEFGQLFLLQKLSMGTNFLRGSLPESIGALNKLQSLDISNCFLNGIILSSLGQLTNLTDLLLLLNGFIGPIPSSFGNLTKLVNLNLYSNFLQGTLPVSLSHLTHLESLVVSKNLLHGTVPVEIYRNCSSLSHLYLSFNALFGPNHLDVMFDHMPNLQVFDISYNQFSGSLPDNSHKVSEQLTWYGVNANRLTGSLPESLSSLSALQILDINMNDFSGSLPSDIGNCSKLIYIYAFDTHIGGSLPQSLCNLTALKVLDVNNALLTGRILSCVTQLVSLEDVKLYSNHLSGRVPTDLIHIARNLKVLLLQNNHFDGAILQGNASDAIRANPSTSLQNFDVSSNRLTGSIPTELFAFSSLKTFALVANCIDSTLYVDMCNAVNLEALALDGMNTACTSHVVKEVFSGSIPDCLFQLKHLTTLHLSGNGITGTFPDVLKVGPSLRDLSLSHNELHGSIPHSFQTRCWANLDLSYNKLSDSLSNDFASPGNDSHVALAVNRLSGELPWTFYEAQHISVLQGSMFSCDYSGKSLPRHDSDRSNYSCGSNSLNVLMYVWIGLFCVATAVTGLMSLSIVSAGRFETQLSWELLNKLRVLFIQITCMIMFVLMPVYLWCSYNYKNYVYSYAWILSATYVSGRTVTIILFVFWMLFLVVMFYLCERCLFRTEFRKHIINRTITTSNIHSVKNIVVLSLTVLLNIVLVVSLNAVYVYIDITYNGTINTLAQIGLALFKLGWNNYLLPQSLKRVFMKHLQDKTKSEAENRIIADRVEMSHVVAETLLNLFNNIIAPCIATMAINVNCFYNVAVPPPVVQTQYSVDLCELINQNFACTKVTTTSIKTSYAPPFSYSYQCSSALVTSYVSVFMYVYIFGSFITPVIMYWLRITVLRTTKKAVKAIRHKNSLKGEGVDLEQVAVPPEDKCESLPRDDVNERKEREREVVEVTQEEGIELSLQIPTSEKRTLSVRSSENAGSPRSPRSPNGQQMTKPITPFHFNKQRFIINFISNTAIMMTFGVIFPPLALIICYNVLRDFGGLQSEIARFHEQQLSSSSRMIANDKENKLKHIENKLRNVSHTISHLLWLLFPLSSAFCAFFVFDMLGDVSGWRLAVIVAVIMFAAPLLFMLSCEVYRYVYQTHGWSSTDKRSVHDEIEWGDAYHVDEDDKEDDLGQGGGRKRRASGKQMDDFGEATEDCWQQLISAFLR